MTSGNDAVTIFVLFIIQIMIIIVYLTEGPDPNNEMNAESEDGSDYRTARGKLKFEVTESILSAGETFDYSGKYRIVRFFRFGNHFRHLHYMFRIKNSNFQVRKSGINPHQV